MKAVTDGLLVEPVAVVLVVLGVGVTTTTFVTVSEADSLPDCVTVADSVAVVTDSVAVVVDSDSVVPTTVLVALVAAVVEDADTVEELEEMGLPSVTLKGACPEGYATPL